MSTATIATSRPASTVGYGNDPVPGKTSVVAAIGSAAAAATNAIHDLSPRVESDHATMTRTKNIPANGLVSEALVAKAALSSHRRRFAARHAARAKDSPIRNGSCPIAICDPVPIAKRAAPARAPLPNQRRLNRAKHHAAPAADKPVDTAIPSVAATGGYKML